MRTAMPIAALALMTLGAALPAFDEPIPLKVLYAGKPNRARTADFRAFLEAHFAKVGVGDYLALSAAGTKGYDVVILDWPDLPPRDDKGFQRPALERDYDRPTILIGGGTLAVGRHLELKVDDLCICLGDAAHGIRTEHEIFHKPYKVDIALEDRPTPSSYRSWPEGEKLGRAIKVWKVQERGWTIEQPIGVPMLPGMVSDPYGFEDSPDAEIISGGINMKSPASVAIGRHGNFLLWGFYGSPSALTPEARKCLVNAICYIRKFDGQKPIVHKFRGRMAREWALAYPFFYKDISNRERFTELQPEAVRKDAAKVAELHRKQAEAYRAYFPEDARRQLGTDPNRYIEYYRNNLEFLRPKTGSSFPFEVDEDVKGLGLSNRKLDLLDRCIAMLERNDRPELALRILKRYTTEDYPDAGGWRSWLKSNRRRLFFTDVGGFKFLVTPESSESRVANRKAGGIPGAKSPIVVEAGLSPVKVHPGETLEFIISVKLAPAWHIYAAQGSDGPSVATTLKLTLPKGVEPDGEWAYPDPVRGKKGQMIYEGTLEFRRKLRVEKAAAQGPIDLILRVRLSGLRPLLLPAADESRTHGPRRSRRRPARTAVASGAVRYNWSNDPSRVGASKVSPGKRTTKSEDFPTSRDDVRRSVLLSSPRSPDDAGSARRNSCIPEETAVATTVDRLILDLLEWIGPSPRPYFEVMEAWRTSCPRLPVWEEADERGFVERSHESGQAACVRVSAMGREFLGKHREAPPASVPSIFD